MALVKLFCKNVNQKGKKIVLPMAGEVEVSNEGIISVEQEVADFMVEKGGGGYEIVGVESTTKTGKTGKAAKAGKTEITVDSTTEGEATVTKEDLENLDLSEILDIVEASGIAKDKYKKFIKSKPLLINFLLKNS